MSWPADRSRLTILVLAWIVSSIKTRGLAVSGCAAKCSGRGCAPMCRLCRLCRLCRPMCGKAPPFRTVFLIFEAMPPDQHPEEEPGKKDMQSGTDSRGNGMSGKCDCTTGCPAWCRAGMPPLSRTNRLDSLFYKPRPAAASLFPQAAPRTAQPRKAGHTSNQSLVSSTSPHANPSRLRRNHSAHSSPIIRMKFMGMSHKSFVTRSE